MALPRKILELDQAIKELKAAAEKAYALSSELPAAERNAYVILRQIEMLEIEICDPVTVLAEDEGLAEEEKNENESK